MNKRAILIPSVLAMLLIGFSLAAAQKSAVVPRKITPLPADQVGHVKTPVVTGEKDYCLLYYTDWVPYAYYEWWKYGDKVAIYFDPEDCGNPENYPFQLTDVELVLYDFAGVGQVDVRFSVEVMCPDICDGPGIEIWKSQVYTITTFHPDVVRIDFPDIVCLDKPFFFNVEYMSDYPEQTMPSLFFDRQPVDTCFQWVWDAQPRWWEWYDFWYPFDVPGWVLLGISGYCGEEQTDCGWWYWKPDTLPQAPSGMPDFDQNQDEWVAYCGPTAVANCLWWFDAVPPEMTPPDFIELLAGYFSTTSAGTYVDSIQVGLDRYFRDYGFALKETTYWMPDFYEMEESLKVCQDIVLLLGFWWWDDYVQEWWREGGHFVTMAGVNSEKKEIAISDPDRDQCVQYFPWWPGRVRTPDHLPWGAYGPDYHNNPQYVSHDVYISLLYPEFPSPGSDIWELADYCYEWFKYANMNVPERFRAVTKPAPKHFEYWHTELEAAIMICPRGENHPPEIGQPDFLEGYVDDVVEYTITGDDPDGDVIEDDASIVIQPVCGSGHSITRILGHGTSSGTWQITWYTTGCTPCDTHMVIHDLTDQLGATAYCTTEVHLSEKPAWYWKDPYPDYAPSGMVDIDQKQDGWMKIGTDQWSFCGPVAVANCFKWFDSKYNVPPGFPGDGIDVFPLVRDYMDQLAPYTGVWDDHDPWNVDHMGTGWNPGVGLPPPTSQPFVPGPQPQPSGMPAWGELVERLAWFFDTDGIQSGYCNHTGTNILQMQQGIQDWLESETFENGSSLADSLCEVTTAKPTFAYVESLVEKCEDVILLLGFWFYEGSGGEQEFIRGDLNEDGIIETGDLIACMAGPPFSCDDASDVNDDGVWDMGDCTYLQNFLSGGPQPPPPYPNCGTDPTPDALDCVSFPSCPTAGQWWRIGGHYVTVAGVNSDDFRIALSDPFIDAFEVGISLGRFGDGDLIPHSHGTHDPTVHNDEGNVSHDVYMAEESPSPGGLWGLREYAVSYNPLYWTGNFFNQNVPDEFVPVTAPWNQTSVIHTEVEYCVHISPWEYRGDVEPLGNPDGDVDLGDLLFIVNYLYKGGPAPAPLSEGDVSCDGVVDLGDVLAMVSYLYKGGPVLGCCDP